MAKKKKASTKPPSFEDSLAELEAIVAKLEGGQLGLAESLEEYERGVKHLKSCYAQLTAAERRIELVSQVDPSGKAKTEAFDDESSASLDQQGSSRNRRRSAPQGKHSAAQGTQSAPKSKRRKGDGVDDGSSLF